MAFGRKKKNENEVHKGDLMVADGIYLKQATMKNGNIIVNCFLRALIVFALVLGSTGGFLSAFDISFNPVMVIGIFMLLSMYFSFLYAASKFIYRDLGYVIFFAIFVFAIYVLRIYANSGFYVIVNDVLQEAKSFFDLPGVREYEVEISNDILTVSIVTCFIGMLEIIILNIWMYSIMSMFWTILFTFPIMFIPIYMKLSPDPLYMVLLSIGYMAVLVFKANGHYVVFAWDTPLKIRGILKKRVSYTQDSGIFRQVITSLTMLFLSLVILISGVMNSNRFHSQFKNNRLWNDTAEYIGNFLVLGFSSLYDQYPNTGGMSSGKLGGVSNVTPDYLTDLFVTFVPFNNEAIYLKGFTGGIYGDNQWLSIYDETGRNGKNDQEIFEDESMKSQVEDMKRHWTEKSGTGRMTVQNIGADTSYLYYPYYTEFEDYTIYNNHNLLASTQGLPRGRSTDHYFYPKVVWESELGAIKPSEIDKSEINAAYMDVPEKNREVIGNICDEIGLNENMTENEIVDAVDQFFEDNYPYTLRPGRTPSNEDFINYFLKKNKKGYCAHFASSAVLIFRYMGIPARYVEGYAFSMETVFASDEQEDLKPEDYYLGYTLFNDAPVVKVDVSDAQAHAWVEVYVDGFGWKTVEVTPGSNEATEEDDFWDAFGRLFQGGINQNDNNGGNALSKIDLSRYVWIIYAIIGIILLSVIVVLLRISIRKIKRYRLCHQENKRDAVIARYADICDMLRLSDASFNGCRSHKEQLLYIASKYDVRFDVEDIKIKLERMSFHDEYPEGNVTDELCELIASVRKQIIKSSKLKMKIRLWLR